MDPLLYGPDGSVVVARDDADDCFDVELSQAPKVSSDLLWLVKTPALSMVHRVPSIEKRQVDTRSRRAVERLGKKLPPDPVQARRAEAAKRLGGGPIVKEQQRLQREQREAIGAYLHGLIKRPVG